MLQYVILLVCYRTKVFFYRKEVVPFGFDELEVHSLNHCFDCPLLIGCIVEKMSMFFSLEFTAGHYEQSIIHSILVKILPFMGLNAICNCIESLLV